MLRRCILTNEWIVSKKTYQNVLLLEMSRMLILYTHLITAEDWVTYGDWYNYKTLFKNVSII